MGKPSQTVGASLLAPHWPSGARYEDSNYVNIVIGANYAQYLLSSETDPRSYGYLQLVFILAVTLVHELAHALFYDRFREHVEMIQWSEKKISDEYYRTEMGWSWERETLGASIEGDTPWDEAVGELYYQPVLQSNETPRNLVYIYDDLYIPIQPEYVCNLFRDDYWELRRDIFLPRALAAAIREENENQPRWRGMDWRNE